MSYRVVLPTGLIGFAAGVLFESAGHFGLASVWFLFIVALVFAANHLFFHRQAFLLSFCFFLLAGLGAWRTIDFRQPAEAAWLVAPTKVEIKGHIATTPETRDSRERLVIKADDKEGKILTYAPLHSGFKYGDQVRASGILRSPQNFFSEDGRLFNYRMYLARERIYYELDQPTLSLVSPGRLSLRRALFSVRDVFLEKINQLMPEPAAALAGGILLGVKESLGQEWLHRFQRAGLSHLIVLSGYNVTVVAGLTGRMLAFLPSLAVFPASVVAVFLFVLGTGAASATVRAALMAVGLLLAQRIGRPYHGGIILLVSGFLMIAANPLFLVFDPGFQLSFLATLGLIYLSPGIEIGIRRLFRNAVWQKIAVVAGQTLAAQIAVLPWLLFMTGKLAANAFLANLIVLPLIPLVMMTSFLAATSSFLFWPLALPFAWLSYLALAYLLAVASVFSIMPGVISTGSPPLIFVALLYGLIFYVYLSLKYPRRFLLPFHRT